MRRSIAAAVVAALLSLSAAEAQFEVGGDARVNPDDFAVTVFADGLNYPVGMDRLEDGSILVAVSVGNSYFSSGAGQILRLVDADDDGVAETRQVLGDAGVGAPSALQRVGDLLFVTGQGRPIVIFQLGSAPDFALTELGRIDMPGSGDWLHPNSALVARRAAGSDDVYEVFFPLGSKVNYAPTTDTRGLETTFGLSGRLGGDAIHRVTFRRQGTTLTGIEHVQIATGLRSASGLAFHPVTGDLYFEDNGIDGLVVAIEAHSADEINMIPNADLGGAIEDFGFPYNHIAYRTGEFVGGEGIPPLVAFTALPNPADGSESEGPNEIAFAPPGFPAGLNNGLFVGFHGQFSKGGLENEENPLVYVDLATREYFHFVSNTEPNVGHLDGLLAWGNRLWAADISADGGFGSGAANSGAIYEIRYIGEPVTAVVEVAGETPEGFALGQAYPNPFNPSMQVEFNVPAAGAGARATLSVYDVTGRRVATLHEGHVAAGRYRAAWDGRDDSGRAVASGSYLLQLRVGDVFEASRRVTLLK